MFCTIKDNLHTLVRCSLQSGLGLNVNCLSHDTHSLYLTPLQFAVECGSEALVELLLEHGADINMVGSKYGTALCTAAYHGSEAIVNILLEHGADVDIVGGKYRTALV